MNSEERTLIDGLFSRLHDAERQSAARDAEADAHIAEHVARQPAAPYYMAQTILIQEAALKRQDQRVKELEAQLAEMQQQRPSSGGFLSGLFGGGARDAQPQPSSRPDGWGQTRFSQGAAASDPRPAQPAALPGQGGGFMRGALQTAAGVAGGVMMADMLSGLFHHGSPTEIVEVVEPPLQQDPGNFDAGSPGDSYADDSYFDGGDFFDGGDDSFFS
ncbi:DUF2076 domain-containing protein [Pseudomonas sp. GOM7]|uniref:DUF2076 domain-containing protein n=1 Tax=unclassified Pseudomonas TaxID=196821 RepID=UPI00227B6C5A|nr:MULTISPECIES: DUF2076 domain-containing protein [unclassified Pseudomonas]WAJ37087.1 DUF2076 domain-containing protein [Pseudomonas sp. GOM7]